MNNKVYDFLGAIMFVALVVSITMAAFLFSGEVENLEQGVVAGRILGGASLIWAILISVLVFYGKETEISSDSVKAEEQPGSETSEDVNNTIEGEPNQQDIQKKTRAPQESSTVNLIGILVIILFMAWLMSL